MIGDSIILYPRSYNTRGKEHLHSVFGMSRDGEAVNVKLRIPDEYLQRKGVPKISEFAKVDRLATQPCIASDDNCLERREGVLLFTNVQLEDDARKGYKSYIARWAFVLAEDSNSPEPIIGRGRIHVDGDTPDLEEKRRQLHLAEQKGDRKIAAAIQESLNDRTLFNYPVLLYHNMTTRFFDDPTGLDWATFIDREIRANSQLGIEGGIYAKLHDPRGALINDSLHERYVHYDYASMRYIDIDKTIEEVRRWLMAVWENHPDTRLLLMPASRINPGFRTRRFLAGDEQFDAIMRTYYRRGKPLMCPIAVRVQRIDEAGMTFAKRVIPIARPMGLLENTDESGTPLAHVRHISADGDGDSVGDEGLPLERPIHVIDSRFISRRHDLMIDVPATRLPQQEPISAPSYATPSQRSEAVRTDAASQAESAQRLPPSERAALGDDDKHSEAMRQVAQFADARKHPALPGDGKADDPHHAGLLDGEETQEGEGVGGPEACANVGEPRHPATPARRGLARFLSAKKLRGARADDSDERP